MILAAGRGTRLAPLTDELPKPLLWVGDRPMVAHVLERLVRGGVTSVVLNTHHLAEAFHDLSPESSGCRFAISHETELLGTGGGIAHAARLLGTGDVVVWNGDILAEVDVASLLAVHKTRTAAATLAIVRRTRGEGTVGIDADGRIVRMRNEVFGAEASGGDFIGVQVLGESIRHALPNVGCLVGDAYLPALRRGDTLVTQAWDGPWHDIGTLDAYLDANKAWLAKRDLPAHVGADARVDPNAVDASGSVIGEGAAVVGRGLLRGCVVWPRATAHAPLESAVVTTGGRVVTREKILRS